MASGSYSGFGVRFGICESLNLVSFAWSFESCADLTAQPLIYSLSLGSCYRSGTLELLVESCIYDESISWIELPVATASTSSWRNQLRFRAHLHLDLRSRIAHSESS